MRRLQGAPLARGCSSTRGSGPIRVLVGFEDALVRVNEIRVKVGADPIGPDLKPLAGGQQAGASPTTRDVAAFQQELARQYGAAAAGAPPVSGAAAWDAETLQSMQGGGLPIEAMLAGSLQQAAPAAPQRVSGDLEGLNTELLQALERVAADLGKDIDVISGHRSYDEQAALYQKYLDGTGNLAAPPGHSNHESGNAADVYVDGVALANVPGASEVLERHGIHFPVGGEPWHAELHAH